MPSAWVILGILYVVYFAKTQNDVEFKDWYDKVIVFVFPPMLWLILKSMIATGELETPSMTRERKRKEAEQEEAELSRYQNLSEEGKLLYELNKKQAKTEENTRVIYGMIFGGAIGYLVFYFWPF